jgi:hypothetical protein
VVAADLPGRSIVVAGLALTARAAVPPSRLRYPLLATAVERHLAWARDFALAGDVDSAVDAIRDAHAASAELRSSEDAGGAP